MKRERDDAFLRARQCCGRLGWGEPVVLLAAVIAAATLVAYLLSSGRGLLLLRFLSYGHAGSCAAVEAAPHVDLHSFNHIAGMCGDGGGVVLAYDNVGSADGAGAQLQRALGLYQLSFGLGVGFAHVPLRRVGYQGLQALEANADLPGIEDRWNAAFSLSDHSTLGCSGRLDDNSDGCVHVQALQPTLEDLAAFGPQCRGGKRLVVHAVHARRVLDLHPELASHPDASLGNVLPWLRGARTLQPTLPALRIAVHVRRGELYVVDSDRMLPNSYYVTICQVVGRVLRRMNVPHVFEIFTEQVAKPVTIAAGHHGIGGRIKGTVILDPTDNKLSDFDVLVPKPVMRVNTDSIEAIQDMASAPIFIMSRSSFSFVAASLHDPGHGLVVYHPFWHTARPDWFVVDPSNMERNEGELERRLRGLIRC
jgi:hypothetical protein